MSEHPIVVVVHSARRYGKTADMERVCAELKARGFEVLEVEAKDEPMLLGWTRDYFRDLYLSARAAGDHGGGNEGKETTCSCTNNAPAGYTGHWRDWHRGHGCDKDPGVE